MPSYIFKPSEHDVADAEQYWHNAFLSVTSQPQLHCFPPHYQWPRSETVLATSAAFHDAALQFTTQHGLNLDSLIYAACAIVFSKHAKNCQDPCLFAVSRGGHLATSSKASVDNHIYPLILSIPESETCLSWIRSVEEATMRASRHAYIGYEHIMETSSARDRKSVV